MTRDQILQLRRELLECSDPALTARVDELAGIALTGQAVIDVLQKRAGSRSVPYFIDHEVIPSSPRGTLLGDVSLAVVEGLREHLPE